MKKTIIAVVLLSVVGKSFGLIRDMLITNYFGFNEVTDALYISISVVLLLFSVFNTVIRTTFSPMFSSKSIENQKKSFSELNSVGNFIIILLLIVSLLTYIFPQFFLFIVSPGVSELTSSYAIKFIKLLSFVILFYGFVSILNGYLQAVKVYKTSEIAGLINNLTIIIIFLILFAHYSYISIIYAYITGAVLQFLFVYIIFTKNTNDSKWNFLFFDLKPIKEFSLLSRYLLLSAFVSQLTVLSDKFIASFLNTGAITALQYANTIKNLPITLVVMVVTNVLFTNLSINQQKSQQLYEKIFLIK
ncbi:lipid II flippase MurJ [Planococcus koreensis]|uniref:lipid II flippase MurJ n=1 Tax=Planococcus koreensis TaxID=112331 RepID=UPI00107FDC67|nr:lipid II flippase MurJ [Planococcus koreensis]